MPTPPSTGTDEPTGTGEWSPPLVPVPGNGRLHWCRYRELAAKPAEFEPITGTKGSVRDHLQGPTSPTPPSAGTDEPTGTGEWSPLVVPIPGNGRLHWCWYRGMVASGGAGTGNWLPSQPNSSQLPVPRVQSATISRDQPAPHHHLPAPIDQQTPGNGRLHWCRHREMVVSTGAGTEEWSSPLVLVPGFTGLTTPLPQVDVNT